MQGEHCLLNSDTVHSVVHAQVRREGERFLRFSNLLLLIFKLPNIDKDQQLLKNSLLSVRSFLLQDIFPAYTLSSGSDELLNYLQAFLKELKLTQFSDLLSQWECYSHQFKMLLDQSFDQFIALIWQQLQSSQTMTMHSCYKLWLNLCDETLQRISETLLTLVNNQLISNNSQPIQAILSC
ncbi:hypothetical protein [Piscirickettsia litoralis]|uniref:Uncharacterized protein n=1 Tax=Piscirickettsia litoralis TaxID=1891921 RepID=A0ABX3A9T4_9GAMM|nr:hypothetical protein [Piscirickettsia litoralis]ODN42884.1 hypothetical protein BGC07_08040 [Piscirickettsia litoralis]